MPDRLRLAFIQAKPKRVHVVESWRDPLGIKQDSREFQALRLIRSTISTGTPLPRGYYRSDRDSSPDELLATKGIMHLHLGNPSTNELLFLIQYPTYVAFLEINNHQHFKTDPVGTLLTSLHEKKVAALREKFSEDSEAKRLLIKQGLKPRSDA